MLVTFLASYLIWVLYLGLVYLWVIDGRIKKEVALHAFLAVLVASSVAQVLKEVFQTNRPFIVDQLIPLTATVPHDFAFPSSHTAQAFALAVTVWLHNKRIGWLFIAVAVVIGVARVSARVHWPIDILGGAMVGSCIAVAIEKLHVFSLLQKSFKRSRSR